MVVECNKCKRKFNSVNEFRLHLCPKECLKDNEIEITSKTGNIKENLIYR